VTALALTYPGRLGFPLARAAFVGLGATIPISTALDGILTAIIVLAWLFAARFRETADIVRNNPVALAACLWFLVHVLGVSYSIGTANEAWDAAGDAAALLLIPIGLIVLRDSPRQVRLAHAAFMAAIAVTMFLAYARWFGLLSATAPLLKSTAYSASVVFKYHLTQNILMAFGAFLFAVYARGATTNRRHFLLVTCSALCAINVLVVGDGRIGQVLLVVLALYYGGWCFGRSGVAAALVVLVMAGAAAYAVPGSSLQKRAAVTVQDAEVWREGGTQQASGLLERVEFFRRSAAIIAANPLFGVGSGGFAAADRELASREGKKPANHPHNEYLLQAVELGSAGPVLMIGLFLLLWRMAVHLPDRRDVAIARGVALMYAFGSGGTSMLSDHTEALLFAWVTALAFCAFKGTKRARKPQNA
jgi:O-antigen ligase